MRRQSDTNPKRPPKKPRKRRPKKTKPGKGTLSRARTSKKKNCGRFYESDIVKLPKIKDETDASDFIEVHYSEDQGSCFEEEKTSCLITSSTVDEQQDLCITYGDLEEYQEEMGQAEVSEEFKHEVPEAVHTYTDSFDYVDCGSIQASTTSMDMLDIQSDQMEEPIFVDLTTDESKAPWKQSLLNQYSKIDSLKESSPDSLTDNKNCMITIGESQIMIADSSSRPNRGSLATALKDRGPCMIPVQPNRSLPIRPAPPIPTRSLRKVRSPILKLSRVMNIDVVEVEPLKSIVPTASLRMHGKANADHSNQKEKDHLSKESTEGDNFLVTNVPTEDFTDDLKRKHNEINGREKEVRDLKKKKKSHEPDSSQTQEDFEEGLSENYGDRAIDKSDSILQQDVELWPEKKCSMPVVSTTDDFAKKDTGNKLVPPLRLKKITCRGGERYRSSVVTVVPEKESNYRIVTGATPRPESRFVPVNMMSPWTSPDYGDNLCIDTSTENQIPNSKSSVSKTNGPKLKNRRNRLKQKLRDLRNKVRELTEQMTNPSITDSDVENRKSIKQTINRYGKQIENISNLLNKLSASIPVSSIDIVEVDEEYDNGMKEKLLLDYDDAKQESLDDDMSKSTSLISSPEPPKLSPRSPNDYAENKLSDILRNSPPILPRVSLSIPTNFDIRENFLETNSDEKVWTINGLPMQKISKERDEPELKLETDHIYNGTEDEVKVMSTVLDTEQESQSKKNIQYEEPLTERFQEKDGSQDEKLKLTKSVSCVDSNNEIEKLTSPKPDNVSDGLAVDALSGADVPNNVQCNQTYKSTVPNSPTTNQSGISTTTNNLQISSNYCGPVNQENVLDPSTPDEARNTQQVISSSNLPTSSNLEHNVVPVTFAHLVPATPVIPNQRVILLKTNKGESVYTNAASKNDSVRIMSEQFPTFGSWVARMSKKQASRSKSKSQDMTSVPSVSAHNSTSFTGIETQKVPTSIGTNATRNNIVNVAPQWNAERWQRQNHNQQRQQQQLLHQVGIPGTAQQTLPVASSLRPSICPPISVLPNSQFYPSSYSIDPYSGAPLSYHSVICPYGPYPYHTRLHTGPPLAGYHIPIQEALNSQLRPLQHMDKRFAALQESIRHMPTDMLKYPSSLPATTGCQHSSGVEYERLRGSTITNNAPSTSCLPPLLLPPPSHVTAPLATSSTQALSRPSLIGYSTTNGQFARNRMIPDVVAAAAAAAVVAAASIGRQEAPLPSYNETNNESAAQSSIPSNIQPDTSEGSTAIKSIDANNQSIANNGNKERSSAGGYHQLQNLLLDRLPFVKTADYFAQTSSANLDSQAPTSTTSSGYKPPPSIYSHNQQSKELLGNDTRYCETPHLGKVNRSSNNVNELGCSNCGVLGAVFKCLGCGAAFYCDERCQTQHWSVHVEKCPKKMPKLKKVT